MATPKIFPVIHYLDRDTAVAEVGKSVPCGADGVFLAKSCGITLKRLGKHQAVAAEPVCTTSKFATG